MAWERIIFFDLETTSLHRVGQILNFCFVCVDSSWKELARLKGEIKISRLELPDPLAIVSTGIDVIALNERATCSERDAMLEIQKFFDAWSIPRKTALSGYNIERFDIPYLRTSMLRSGVFPYAHPTSNDLLLLVRYLLATNEELRVGYQTFLESTQTDPVTRISATLEKITKYLGLLTKAQAHESEDDVDLTIALAKAIEQRFGVSIFSFCGYEIEDLHQITKQPVRLARYSGTFENAWHDASYVFLRVEGKASYWLDVEAYNALSGESSKRLGAIRRMKFNEEIVRPSPDQDPASMRHAIAADAWTNLHTFKVDDLYPERKCYVENWIYRLSPQAMKDLIQRINFGPRNHERLNPDQRLLFNRFLLANCEDLKQVEHLVQFQKYVHFRYGSSARMRLEEDRESDTAETPSRFHPTLSELVSRFDLAYQKVSDDSDRKHKEHALHQLRVFYRQSPIPALLGATV